MTIETTYTNARANLASLCKKATSDHEEIIIHRRGQEDVALISAEELAGLKETAHLLRSSANAKRLLTSLQRALTEKPTKNTKALDELKEALGL